MADKNIQFHTPLDIKDLTRVVIPYEIYHMASFINFLWNDLKYKILFIIM